MPMLKIRTLSTASEIIDALGGTTPFAALINREQQHVSNYRAAGRLPARTYLIVTKELKKRRLTAPAHLWGIDEDESVSAAG